MKKARFDKEARKKDIVAPHLSVSAGFGTLQCRLPWFHRAVPSATLDKGYVIFDKYLISFLAIVNTNISLFSGKMTGLSIVKNLYMTFHRKAGIMPV